MCLEGECSYIIDLISFSFNAPSVFRCTKLPFLVTPHVYLVLWDPYLQLMQHTISLDDWTNAIISRFKLSKRSHPFGSISSAH